jgi:hypothetical protein
MFASMYEWGFYEGQTSIGIGNPYHASEDTEYVRGYWDGLYMALTHKKGNK